MHLASGRQHLTSQEPADYQERVKPHQTQRHVSSIRQPAALGWLNSALVALLWFSPSVGGQIVAGPSLTLPSEH